MTGTGKEKNIKTLFFSFSLDYYSVQTISYAQRLDRKRRERKKKFLLLLLSYIRRRHDVFNEQKHVHNGARMGNKKRNMGSWSMTTFSVQFHKLLVPLFLFPPAIGAHLETISPIAPGGRVPLVSLYAPLYLLFEGKKKKNKRRIDGKLGEILKYHSYSAQHKRKGGRKGSSMYVWLSERGREEGQTFPIRHVFIPPSLLCQMITNDSR